MSHHEMPKRGVDSRRLILPSVKLPGRSWWYNIWRKVFRHFKIKRWHSAPFLPEVPLAGGPSPGKMNYVQDMQFLGTSTVDLHQSGNSGLILVETFNIYFVFYWMMNEKNLKLLPIGHYKDPYDYHKNNSFIIGLSCMM